MPSAARTSARGGGTRAGEPAAPGRGSRRSPRNAPGPSRGRGGGGVGGAADRRVVVGNGGGGDGGQANKGGVWEIAEVLVVNRADRDGAADTVRDLEMMLELAGDRDWRPPIVQTVATDSRGVEDLWRAVLGPRADLQAARRRRRPRDERPRGELRASAPARLPASA